MFPSVAGINLGERGATLSWFSLSVGLPPRLRGSRSPPHGVPEHRRERENVRGEVGPLIGRRRRMRFNIARPERERSALPVVVSAGYT